MKHEIDYILQTIYGFSDEQLLKEFKEAEAEVQAEGESEPDPESFERLWKKLQELKRVSVTK